MTAAAAFTEVGGTAFGGFNGNTYSNSFADYDNDGDPDVLFMGGTRLGTNTRVLLKNMFVETGTAAFENVTSESGMSPESAGWSAGWGDYDGDGFVDVFLGQSNPSGARGDLMHNNGDGTFTNVSSSTVNDPGFHQNVGWMDADLDGDLDLLLAMEGPEPHELYVQNANGSFTQAGQTVGLWIPYDDGLYGKAYGTAIGDYDDDGDYDIYISTCRGGGSIPKNFFRNRLKEDGVLTFEDIAIPNGTQWLANGYGTEFLDFDDDGDLDLYATGADEEDTRFFRNEGAGVWTDMAASLGHPVLDYVGSDLNGAKAVDYDNDGDLDLFFHDHLQQSATNSSCALFRNDGNWTYVRVTSTEGLEHANEGGYDSAWADVDMDGDMDLCMSTNSTFAERLYLNDASANGNRWLQVRPRTSMHKNTRAIGAALYATINKGMPGERTIRREANTNIGTFNQSDVPVHFGLGPADVVDELRIVWPDGKTNTWRNIAANQYITLWQHDVENPVLQLEGGADALMLH